MPLKEHKGIFLIIAMFVAADVFFLMFYDDVWWDSAVYIGMGKYIHSLGKSGLWEESRPLAYPLILGLGWKIEIDPVYFGRILSIVFSALTVFLAYRIGLKLFSKKEALLAAFFTAFSFTFFFFSPNMLTDIPSTFFALLAFYFFIEKRFFFTGFFAGIAIMTRFFQAFALAGIGVAFAFHFRKKLMRKAFYVVVGMSIFIVPYLLLNAYLYGDIFLPFKVQSQLTQTTGWMLYKDYGFYFLELLKENFFLLFLAAFPLYFRRSYKLDALVLVPLVYILTLSLVKHKEMRFMLAIIPYLYILLSYTLFRIYGGIKHKKFAAAVFVLLVMVWIGMSFIMMKNAVHYNNKIDASGITRLQEYMKGSNERVWITSPLYALHSDKKVGGLPYYLEPKKLVEFIASDENKVDAVLYGSCDMECMPDDQECEKSRKIFLNMLTRFKKTYENDNGQCKYAIYRITY